MSTAGRRCGPTPTRSTIRPPSPIASVGICRSRRAWETLRYMAEVEKQLLEQVALHRTCRCGLFHAAVRFSRRHAITEAFTYTRQTLGYPAPRQLRRQEGTAAGDEAPWSGDADIPGGMFSLGAEPGGPFVFDNEKWAHPVSLRPFAIARSPVTQAEFAAFVEEGGYCRRELWCVRGMGLARARGGDWATLLAARSGRLDAARFRPLAGPGAAPAGGPRQLV